MAPSSINIQSTALVQKKEIIKMEQLVYANGKSCYTRKEIDQALISINPLKKQNYEN
jgi:hypothetical protein